MKKYYTYDDVLIKPQYSEIDSRSEVSLKTKLHNIELDLPIVTANMKTVTGAKMCEAANKAGAFGILHRFNTIEENCDDFKSTRHCGISIGVKDEGKKRFEALYEQGARVFCIDVAHGHHKHVKDILHWITGEMFKWARHERGNVTLIAGNVATGDAYYDLADWGADVVKVGIGPGSVCQTRKNTGCGVPQLGALEDIYQQKLGMLKSPAIIADGGIKHVGDIAKALKYADAVMLGSYLAGTSESPGHVFRDEHGEFYKVYAGSASAENKGENKFVEGVTSKTKFKGKVKYLFREIEHGLQSAFSYVGAHTLDEFKNNCEFIEAASSISNEGNW